MRNEHNWTERTEDGVKREVRATRFATRWKIQSKLDGEEYWTTHDDPDLHDVRELRDVLFRKYQRKRAAWDDVVHLREWVKRLDPTDGSEDEEADEV